MSFGARPYSCLVRSLAELISEDRSARAEIEAAVSAAPCAVEILPTAPVRAATCRWRWPGWQDEVAGGSLGSRDLAEVGRRPIAMTDRTGILHDDADQLGR